MACRVDWFAMIACQVTNHVSEGVKVGPDFALDASDPAIAKRHVTVRPSGDLGTRLAGDRSRAVPAEDVDGFGLGLADLDPWNDLSGGR